MGSSLETFRFGYGRIPFHTMLRFLAPAQIIETDLCRHVNFYSLALKNVNGECSRDNVHMPSFPQTKSNKQLYSTTAS